MSEELPDFFRSCRVLEIGSLDINGTIRSHFLGCDYVGLDVAKGAGVDVICEGQNYDAPDNSFDIVISCEVMEHNPHWAETFRNMIRICRPSGLVVMTCATIGRPEHGTTRTDRYSSPLTVDLGWSYYRNLTEKNFRQAVAPTAAFETHRFWVNWNHYDLLFAGIKAGGQTSGGVLKSWEILTHRVDGWIAQESGARVHRYRAAMASLLGDRWFTAMNRFAQTLNWLHRMR